MTSSTWRLSSISPTGSTTRLCRYESACPRAELLTARTNGDQRTCCTCVFSKVLVQFAGVVLIKDESSSDAAAASQAEEVDEQSSEGQEGSEGGAKPSAEENEAAEDGESPCIVGKPRQVVGEGGGSGATLGGLQVGAMLQC